MALSKTDKEVIENLIKPITDQCTSHTEAVDKINDKLETIQVDQATAKERLNSIDKHLQKQNGRLDKTEDKIDGLEILSTKFQSNWGWTRKIVLWIISAGGLVGITIAVINLLL